MANYKILKIPCVAFKLTKYVTKFSLCLSKREQTLKYQNTLSGLQGTKFAYIKCALEITAAHFRIRGNVLSTYISYNAHTTSEVSM